MVAHTYHKDDYDRTSIEITPLQAIDVMDFLQWRKEMNIQCKIKQQEHFFNTYQVINVPCRLDYHQQHPFYQHSYHQECIANAPFGNGMNYHETEMAGPYQQSRNYSAHQTKVSTFF